MPLVAHVLLIFLDGVGLGLDDPVVNPFARAHLPTLQQLAGGHRWLATTPFQDGPTALFIPTDAHMDVPGRPQSGTGQAAIVTGKPVPQLVGRHYGPKPDAATRQIISQGTLFHDVIGAGYSAALLEAYPPQWHEAITSGRRLPSSYQQAAKDAGLPFMTADDLRHGRAISGDWTGAGWREELHIPDVPTLPPWQVGQRLAHLATSSAFSFMPHWLTDVVGHRGPMSRAVELLKTFDAVLAGLLANWPQKDALLVITSDHGNIEDLSHRHHTENKVPTVIVGEARQAFTDLTNLAGIAPRIRTLLI